jgi:hypothetical protein
MNLRIAPGKTDISFTIPFWQFYNAQMPGAETKGTRRPHFIRGNPTGTPSPLSFRRWSSTALGD